jgi:hypothetical protein
MILGAPPPGVISALFDRQHGGDAVLYRSFELAAAVDEIAESVSFAADSGHYPHERAAFDAYFGARETVA